MKQLYTFIFSLFFTCLLLAQSPSNMPQIPPMRQLHHELIIEALKKLDASFDKEGLAFIEQKKWVDSFVFVIRIDIEKDNRLDPNGKFNWLRSCYEMINAYNDAYQLHQIKLSEAIATISTFKAAMILERGGSSIYELFDSCNLEIANILINNFGFRMNKGLQKAKDRIVWKYCQLHPNEYLSELQKNAANTFADTMIVEAARNNPEKLYDYAAAPNALGYKIQSNNNPLVKIIAQLSVTKTGRMYFPFLDKLYHGTISLDSITPMLTDQGAEKYFKLLVATRIEYAKRLQLGESVLLADVLTAKLQNKAIDLYINEINGLHELKDLKLRFKKLDSLSPQELYYLAVMGEQEMYTSSFVNGIYPRIFQKMRNPDADSLLLSVNNDYFKKFLKIAATYNTLDDLLKKMDSTAAIKRMQNFVDGLAKSSNLEDAVDVADSYASIFQPALRSLILKEVQVELHRNLESNNVKGIRMYQLLQDIFLSIDTSNHIDLTNKLGIAPVYSLPLKRLQDSLGRVIIQVYFYGDKDGANIFAAFIEGFQNEKWKIQYKPEWIEISARKGVPVIIFANKPLDAEKDLDEKAQENLNKYLIIQNLDPSIIVHRGHSYYLKETIEKMKSSAKLVILGGCGGYQNLNEILAICPESHIISTKQMGTGAINKRLIGAITEQLRLGQDLNWQILWDDIAKQITRPQLKEAFEDYIPPHKNLGAILIMAYNKMKIPVLN